MTPVWLIKKEEKEKNIKINEGCKFFSYEHECYKELKWGYCKFIHSDQVRRAIQMRLENKDYKSIVRVLKENGEKIRSALNKWIHFTIPPSD